MIIDFSDADESRVHWRKDGKEWKSADLDDLIEAYEATIEPKKGKWEKNSDTAFYWKCSECGAYLFWRKEEYLLRIEDEPNYCPNCGARMTEDEPKPPVWNEEWTRQ